MRRLPLLLLALLTAPLVRAATFQVSTLSEFGGGSLRAAVASANSAAGTDDIVFSAAVQGTIGLFSGVLTITGPVRIHGPGADVLAVDAFLVSRVFDINLPGSGGTVTIEGLTIRSGYGGSSAGAILIGPGDIVTLSSVTVRDSRADMAGGILNYGTLTLDGCAVIANTAVNFGGGIMTFGPLTLKNTTVSGNVATSFDGGGIDLESGGTLTLSNATLTKNQAGRAGGGVFKNATVLDVRNTIIGKNTPSDCSSTLGIGGHRNLSGDATCGFAGAGDFQNADPMLGPLETIGGPTPGHRLFLTSPAIDAGDNATCEGFDQRRVARPIDRNGDGVAVCDLGAYEAATYPGITDITAFLDLCPTDDPIVTRLLTDFRIYRNGVQVVSFPCTSPIITMPLAQYTDPLIVLQGLRTLYSVDLGRTHYLPWTDLSLYGWMHSKIAGFDVRDDTSVSYCCETIGGQPYVVVAAQDSANRDFDRTWRGISGNISLYTHEARHRDGFVHDSCCGIPSGCDTTYDESNLSAYGVQYWLERAWLTGFLNVGYACLSSPQVQEIAQWHLSSANGTVNRFCVTPPPTLVMPATPGGTCLQAGEAGNPEPGLEASPEGGAALTLQKAAGSNIRLDWGGSCRVGDFDYEVYEGQLGAFTSHTPRTCSTAGAATFTLVPGAGNRYYLVVPSNHEREGSYGTRGDGSERPRGTAVCLDRAVGACP